MKKYAFLTLSLLFLVACGAAENFSVLPKTDASSNDNNGGNNGLAGPGITNNPLSSNVCAAGDMTGIAQQYYPTACLVPQQNLASESLGVEINEGYVIPNKVFSILANDQVAGTSANTTLYIEISTYVAPDTIVITAYDATGSPTSLLNICDISTYSQADPTDGTYRPYSDTILQFNAVMPAGTTKLTFDYTGSDTPTYVGVWNLNDFSSSLNAASTNPFLSADAKFFRVQKGPLAKYNDNSDPIPGGQVSCSN